MDHAARNWPDRELHQKRPAGVETSTPGVAVAPGRDETAIGEHLTGLLTSSAKKMCDGNTVSDLSRPYNSAPRSALAALKHPLGYRLGRTISAKPKGERSIGQSSDRKVDGADHVAQSRAYRCLEELSAPGSYRCFGNHQGGAIK